MDLYWSFLQTCSLPSMCVIQFLMMCLILMWLLPNCSFCIMCHWCWWLTERLLMTGRLAWASYGLQTTYSNLRLDYKLIKWTLISHNDFIKVWILCFEPLCFRVVTFLGYLPIPAVSPSSQCAAVPFAHRGSAVKEKKTFFNHKTKDLKACELDCDKLTVG